MIENFPGVVTVSRAGRAVVTGTGDAHTPYQIASISKNVAAMLVLLLVEDGRLDLHEPLPRWLPEAPPAWKALTLHHILSHTSGIGHWAGVPGLDPAVPASRDDRLALILRAPLGPPVFRYSSPAYLLAGVVAERAAGIPYADLLSERILRPLGLTATVSGPPPAGASAGHHDGRPVDWWDLTSMVGAGDLWSTATDLVAYAHAVAAGRLVTPETLALMRTVHAPFPEPDRSPDGRLVVTGYGYGHYLGTFDGEPVALHTGDNPGYKSVIGWFPGDVAVVGLANDDTVQWDDVLSRVLN